MIEVKKVSKSFGSTKALDEISFSVKKGEILGFLGPNGAGKTTALKIITSFLPQDEGEVKIDGLDTIKDSLKTRKRIGYLPENVPLYEDMTVYEYLKFVAGIRGIEKNKIKDRIDEIAGSCGLVGMLKKPIEELSKGYRQRVGLAQSIMHNSEVLILDEPTTGLDPNQIVEIRDLIKKIGEEKTVVFSTHILSEVSAVCDRIIIINKGKIVGEGTPEELTGRAELDEIFNIKIKGDKEKVLRQLQAIEGVERVEADKGEGDNVYSYKVTSKKGGNVREKISGLIISQGWNILEFNKKQVSLEDIFRKLTK
ncbi:ABC transporter ATP-binding protein [bacterium]|nr:ABC transporter ATP-binding protein [bacterium]